jgi:hypothetical protein
VAVTLELLHDFDPVQWQTAPPLRPPGSSVLLTWTMTPPPVDAGIPEPVAHVFAEALCSVGPVIYAGDDVDRDFRLAEDVVVRRGLRQLHLAVFQAGSVAELLPAFSDARHDWAMNAQWLVVMDPSRTASPIDAVLKELYQEWSLPEPLPEGIAMIVQAAVDGDGAACHLARQSVEQRFVSALSTSAQTAGFALRIDQRE